MKTLKDYIEFLRQNGFAQEAYFYETDVVKLLKTFGCEDPLAMSTDEVPAKLYAIYDALDIDFKTMYPPSKVWDVELT